MENSHFSTLVESCEGNNKRPYFKYIVLLRFTNFTWRKPGPVYFMSTISVVKVIHVRHSPPSNAN